MKKPNSAIKPIRLHSTLLWAVITPDGYISHAGKCKRDMGYFLTDRFKADKKGRTEWTGQDRIARVIVKEVGGLP